MAAPVRYRIKPSRPTAHVFEVSLTLDNPDPAGQELRLPNWIPGSYMIRDYARNIIGIRAESDGLDVPLDKLDKSRWRAAPVTRPLTIVAEIYAFDESVRGAHLDTTHAFFNGVCVFLEPVGQGDEPVEVEIEAPDKPWGRHWRVATSMERKGGGQPYSFGTYVASSYDELIDHPVEIGELCIGEFNVRGIPHAIAIRGRQSADMARLCHDLERLCDTHMAMLPPPADLDRYVFLLHTPANGYGGLEHGWSSSMVTSRNSLPQKRDDGEVRDEYRNLLGLISHEYFHLWNVKRMKPAAFRPYELQAERHTRLLWVFEGITSYYDDLTLLRSGLIDVRSYLELVGQTMTRVRRGSGRLKQSVAESSFDAWTKFYKQDANSGNAIVSYYGKGALIAMALDLKLRDETDGAVTLDTVMAACWERFGETGVGLEEHEFEAVAAEIAGFSLEDFFENAVRGTGELPLDALLKRHGIRVSYRAASGRSDKGGKPADKEPDVWFGATLNTSGGRAIVGAVGNDSPAEHAGLQPGDELLAIDGLKVSPARFDEQLRRYRVRDKAELTIFRGDELFQLPLVFTPAPLDTVYLELLGEPDEDARRKRLAFLNA